MTDFRRASVMVGEVETKYARAGSGAPLLLLVPPPRDCSTLAPLTRRWRVIVPESTSVHALPDTHGPAPYATWLRGFLDGLGVPGVIVVADLAFSTGLAAIQREWPDLVRHVQVVSSTGVDWEGVAAALEVLAVD